MSSFRYVREPEGLSAQPRAYGWPLAARLVSAALASLVALACAPSNQEAVTLRLLATGSDVPPLLSVSPTTELELESAQLAFGPFYLCASKTAGELCDTARAEWLNSQIIDLLDQREQSLGQLAGVSGSVASYMFDLGISSLLTHDDPVQLEAALTLGGASLALTGRALIEGQSVPFRLNLPISQTGAENVGIPVVLSSAGALTEHALTNSDESLSLQFSLEPWLEGIDLSPYVEDKSCAEAERIQVCAGTVAQTCADGEPVSTEDCSASEQVCLTAQGCVDELDLPVDSSAAKSIYSRIVTGPGPSFTWNQD